MFEYLKRVYRLCRWIFDVQFGIWPARVASAICAMPSFIADLVKFRQVYKGSLQLMPCLHDRKEQGGNASSEYFIQDLIVAKRIFDRNPVLHVDVGSRVDGFVAHIATFRTIEVLDIRPTATQIAGILFKQADLMSTESPTNYCDSLSCLHALEHFGLGRYGDKLDPSGWKLGLAGLSRLLVSGGRLYLSTPVGKEVVMFNAHRIFSPHKLVAEAKTCGLKLDEFSWIANGRIETSVDFQTDANTLVNCDYALGVFEFIKC